MGIELISGIVALLVIVIPLIVAGLKNRKANRNALLKAESDELGAGMDAVDKLQPPPG